MISVGSGGGGGVGLKEYQSVFPFFGNWVPHPLPPRASASPPLDTKGEEQHSIAGEGAGESNSDDWTESLALCILSGPKLQVIRHSS